MFTDVEIIAIRNSRLAAANADAQVAHAVAVANRNIRAANANARAAAEARADADYMSDEYDKLLYENAGLQRSLQDLKRQNDVIMNLLTDCVGLLDAHGIKIPNLS